MSIPRDVIVIGAAEGGLAPLLVLLKALPAEFPAAVLVTLCRHPRALLGEIMESQADMPISYASDGEEVEIGHIYLSPPEFHLVVRAPGVLGLEARSIGDEPRPAIDGLFRSAAQVYGHRVIGIILSGCDGGGTEGLEAIEDADGIGTVQAPEEAAVPEMPNHALAHDRPHYVASIEGIATLLTTLVGERRVAAIAQKREPS